MWSAAIIGHAGTCESQFMRGSSKAEAAYGCRLEAPVTMQACTPYALATAAAYEIAPPCTHSAASLGLKTDAHSASLRGLATTHDTLTCSQNMPALKTCQHACDAISWASL